MNSDNDTPVAGTGHQGHQEPNTPKSIQESPSHVSIRIIDDNGTEVYFKLKTDTQMKKVFAAYCERKAIGMESIRFVFNGSRVSPESTPKSLEMEDNDIIDVVVAQTGGSKSASIISKQRFF